MKNTIWKLLCAMSLMAFVSINVNAQTVSFIADPVCVNKDYEAADPTEVVKIETTEFTAIAAGLANITGYVWEFGDTQATSTTSRVEHKYAKAGTYLAKVTVNYNNGSSSISSAQKEVKVLAPPQVVFNFGNDDVYSACQGGSPIELTSTIESGISVLWSTGATGPTLNLTDRNLGVNSQKEVGAVAYTQDMCWVKSPNAKVIVYSAPTVSAVADYSTINLEGDPSSTVIHANTDDMNGVTYKWFPADGLDRDDVWDPTFDPTAEGTFIFRVTATKTVGTGEKCASNADVRITVAAPQGDFSTPINANNIVIPNSTYNGWWSITQASWYDGGEFFVYNKWGQEVYHRKNVYQGDNNVWDARTENGEILPEDAYYYVIKNDEITHTGCISVLHVK